MSGSTPTYRRKHHPLKWWVLAEEMHKWWIFDTYVRLRDRVLKRIKRSFHLEGVTFVCCVLGAPTKVEGPNGHIGITTVLPHPDPTFVMGSYRP